MKKSRFSEAQIVGMLRQQEQGQTVAQICRRAELGELDYQGSVAKKVTTPTARRETAHYACERGLS